MHTFWNKDIDSYKKFDKISEDIEVSVCVIGGGLTGVSCAYYLSQHTQVALVERDRICSCTSGANTGKITSQHGLFYDYLTNSKGTEYAKKYLEANEIAINNIERIIKKEDIECDFKRKDAFVFTQKQEEVEKIKKEQSSVDAIQKGKSELVDKIDFPIDIQVAIKFNNQAQFNPVKYVYGLCTSILKNQGAIYEESKATDIKKDGDKYVIYVNDKKIIANYVIIATRYPFISVPGYYFLKMYQSTSYAIVADVKQELFNGMYISSETPTTSFRVVEDGGKKLLLAVGYDYKTGSSQMKNGYKELENLVKKIYPQSQILYKWIAEDCISLDKIPYIGQFSNIMPNVYVATGFNKWGITSSNIAANIISDKILGRDSEFEKIFKAVRMEPIHNKEEVGNMLKEVNKSLILSKFKLPEETINDIKVGQGKVVEVDNTKVGVYKAEDGTIFQIKPKCTHLGCELYFNNIEKIWECPCHGSKFTYDGRVLETPANKDLEKYT